MAGEAAGGNRAQPPLLTVSPGEARSTGGEHKQAQRKHAQHKRTAQADAAQTRAAQTHAAQAGASERAQPAPAARPHTENLTIKSRRGRRQVP